MSYYREGQDWRIEIGETHAVIFPKSSSTGIVAQILHREHDEKGKVHYLVLDRLVHDKHTSRIGEFDASGCFVTELTKSSYKGT